MCDKSNLEYARIKFCSSDSVSSYIRYCDYFCFCKSCSINLRILVEFKMIFYLIFHTSLDGDSSVPMYTVELYLKIKWLQLTRTLRFETL